MTQPILILGANGMLGHDLAQIFSEKKPVLWDQADLDITDEKEVMAKISQLKPAVVINAAAYTDVDGAETNEKQAQLVNGLAVGYLAKACHANQAILVHFSTEYIFSGQNQDGYLEEAKPDPINVYGQSKALGEEQLQKNCEMYYLIRSSWLYGQAPQIGKPRGLNFVQTMLKLAEEGKEIKVVDDQFGKPTYTKDLALKTKEIIDSFQPCGIYHLVNEGVCSWYDFAKAIFALKGLTPNLQAIKSQEFVRPAKRPPYGVLINTKTESLRSWPEALAEYLTN